MNKDKNILLKAILCGSLIGIINGLLGGGGGMLCVPALQKYARLNTKQAHATAVFVMLPISIVSSIVYGASIKVEFGLIALVSLGSVVGGLVGTKLLKNFSNIFIEYTFVAVMLLAGVKMVI